MCSSDLNVDYWDGKSQLGLAPEMLQLRYANYPKDYFMGMLPSSQYGSVAILPSALDVSRDSNTLLLSNSVSDSFSYFNNPTGGTTIVASGPNDSKNVRGGVLNSDLSALSIRATEYLQRWKEVVQFSSKDYSDQMAAQFGIKAPEYMGNHSHYIGGWSNVININEVLNTNLTADDSQAEIGRAHV